MMGRQIDVSSGDVESLKDQVVPGDCDFVSILIPEMLEEMKADFLRGFRKIRWLDACQTRPEIGAWSLSGLFDAQRGLATSDFGGGL
jgi:hypothetical protein